VGNLQGQLTGALANAQGQLTGLTNLFSGGGNLVSGTRIAAGFTNTVKRKTIDSAVVRILGNSKISLPSFEFPSPAVLAERLDIRQAQNILQGLQQQGSQVLNQVSQLQGQVSQLQGQVTRVADQATSTFNRLRG
jgi:peptidoglycan hydrolase CwlO-like protein